MIPWIDYEILSSMHLQRVDCVIIAYDVTAISSFRHIAVWVDSPIGRSSDYDSVLKVILGCKTAPEREDKREVPAEEGIKLGTIITRCLGSNEAGGAVLQG